MLAGTQPPSLVAVGNEKCSIKGLEANYNTSYNTATVIASVKVQSGCHGCFYYEATIGGNGSVRLGFVTSQWNVGDEGPHFALALRYDLLLTFDQQLDRTSSRSRLTPPESVRWHTWFHVKLTCLSSRYLP